MKMKKWISLILAGLMILSLTACGGSGTKTEEKGGADTVKTEEKGDAGASAAEAAAEAVTEKTAEAATDQAAEAATEKAAAAAGGSAAGGWTREGYFEDGNDNFLSVTWMEDVDDPGWFVGCMLGEDVIEDSWGGTIQVEGDTLHGEIASSGEKDPLTVTISEEGENGLLLSVEGGEEYHFVTMDLPDATIIVTVNTEGMGNIEYAEGTESPEIDPEYPNQSAQINLAEPAEYTLLAWPKAGNMFVKWTKNGEDFSTDPQITVNLEESADFIAVFEEDPDWQNPVMNFVGDYQCDRARAHIECSGSEDARIVINWAGSASDVAQWEIVGRLDTETLTIEYSGGAKSHVVYGEGGEEVSRELEYGDGTGTIKFGDDGTFTWHEDQSESGEDMVFEWVPVPVDEDAVEDSGV